MQKGFGKEMCFIKKRKKIFGINFKKFFLSSQTVAMSLFLKRSSGRGERISDCLFGRDLEVYGKEETGRKPKETRVCVIAG